MFTLNNLCNYVYLMISSKNETSLGGCAKSIVRTYLNLFFFIKTTWKLSLNIFIFKKRFQLLNSNQVLFKLFKTLTKVNKKSFWNEYIFLFILKLEPIFRFMSTVVLGFPLPPKLPTKKSIIVKYNNSLQSTWKILVMTSLNLHPRTSWTHR